MRFPSISKLLASTLVIVVGLTAAGFAQEAPEGGQKIVPPPMPDPGTTSQLNCIDQKNEYTKSGKGIF